MNPLTTKATTRILTARSYASQSLFIKRKGASVSATLYKPLLVNKRNALIKEGRCFNCREQGYITRECLKKNIVSIITTAEL